MTTRSSPQADNKIARTSQQVGPAQRPPSRARKRSSPSPSARARAPALLPRRYTPMRRVLQREEVALPAYDQMAQDMSRQMKYTSGRALSHLIRISASKQAGLMEAAAHFRAEHGSCSWTRVRSNEVAKEATAKLRDDGAPCSAIGRYILHRPRDIWRVRAILENLDAGLDSYTTRDGLLVGLPAAGETGLDWETHTCSDQQTAKELARILGNHGFDATVTGSNLQFRTENTEQIIHLLEGLGCREVAKDDLDREPNASPRDATERQTKYINDLYEQGLIPNDEYARFQQDPTFTVARDILDRHSGIKAIYNSTHDHTIREEEPRGPKDTDRDGIADTNEDLDSDGLDYTREEDQRVPVSDKDRDTRIAKLESECTKAAEVDQPGLSGRSEISINPESR